jgi:hypothetical protein
MILSTEPRIWILEQSKANEAPGPAHPDVTTSTKGIASRNVQIHPAAQMYISNAGDVRLNGHALRKLLPVGSLCPGSHPA